MKVACAVLVVLVCAAWAAPAHAVSIVVLEGSLVVLPTPAEANQVTITREGDAYRVSDPGALFFGGCPRIANEPAVLCPAAGVSAILANLGDGDDRLTVNVSLPAEIHGDEGNDVIFSGTGDDRIFGGPGVDELHGGEGDDEVWEEGTDRNRLDGGPGADRVIGGEGPDTITGGDGDDRLLVGFGGDDTIDGGEGDDLIDGGTGPQDLETDADTLAGGPGVDTVTYTTHGFPTQISIGNGPGDGVQGEGDDVRGDVERLIGSEGFDEIVGGSGPDVIDGGGAADVIDGGAGDDVLVGGRTDGGADTIRGGDGRDLLSGGAGGDALDGGPGIDLLSGGGDDDQLSGGADTDLLYGEGGDDRLEGGGGPDLLSGGEGTDTVRYSANVPVQVTLDDLANDGVVAVSRDGRSRVEEGALTEGDLVDATNERVDGSGVDDTVAGDGDPNGLSGASGEDFLDGRGGADTLSGGGRSDTIVARDGRRDRVSCGAGRDYVVADPVDLIDRKADCEYVDDGSTTHPAALRDVTVKPDCAAGKDADLSPPGMRREVPLAQTARVPTGTLVDSFDCDVVVTAASAGSVRLGQKTGTMRITQRRANGTVRTVMRSTDCLTTARAAAAIAHASRYPQPRYRRRYGRVGVHVDVRLDTATIRTRRGVATYEVDDRCGRGATVTVKSGRLSVVDLATGVTHQLGPERKSVTL